MNVRAACVEFLRLPSLAGPASHVRPRWLLTLACGHATMRRRHMPPVVGEEYRCSRCEAAS